MGKIFNGQVANLLDELASNYYNLDVNYDKEEERINIKATSMDNKEYEIKIAKDINEKSEKDKIILKYLKCKNENKAIEKQFKNEYYKEWNESCSIDVGLCGFTDVITLEYKVYIYPEDLDILEFKDDNYIESGIRELEYSKDIVRILRNHFTEEELFPGLAYIKKN